VTYINRALFFCQAPLAFIIVPVRRDTYLDRAMRGGGGARSGISPSPIAPPALGAALVAARS
jgi:hypothetical protein